MGTGQMSVTESKGIPPRRTSDLSPTDVWTTGVLVTFAGSSTSCSIERFVGWSRNKRAGRCLIDESINSSFPGQASGAS